MEANMVARGVDSAEMNVIREISDEAKREARRLAKKINTAGGTSSSQTPNASPFSPSMLSRRQRVAGSVTPSMQSSQPSQKQPLSSAGAAQVGGATTALSNAQTQQGGSTTQPTGTDIKAPIPNVQSTGPPAQSTSTSTSQAT